MKNKLFIILGVLVAFTCSLKAQSVPRALVVIAHPDDESILSVTLYKIAKEQHGIVDLFVITNGEAGFRYSTLAEQYYGCKLTDAEDAREKLPSIRRKELKQAGQILGISHYYFTKQRDSHFSLNEREPLDTSWNVLRVRHQLSEVLARGNYDIVFCLLPEATTHAGHKAATLIALDAVAALPDHFRPIVLAAALRNKTDSALQFRGLVGYPLTATSLPSATFIIDRTTGFSYLNRVNYKVVANWELAAHKSQGYTQMSMNDGDLEEFWLLGSTASPQLSKVKILFDKLNLSPYRSSSEIASGVH